MIRKLYFTLLFFGIALSGYSQDSQINSTVQTFPGGYYGVYGQLTFASGYIVTPRNSPATSSAYFTAGSSYTGASNTSHVNGYAEKDGNTAFVFPVGNGVKLRTAGISAPATSSRFQAAYWFSSPNTATLPAGAPFPTANLGTGVTAVSTKEYWDVNGATSINLTLSWDAESNLGTLTGNSLSRLVIVGYNPATSKWENLGAAGGTIGTLTATGAITANGVIPNNYTAFTFGAIVSLTPDLTPNILLTSSDVIGVSNTTLTLRAIEIKGVPTTGILTLNLRTGVPDFTLGITPGTVVNGWTYVGVFGVNYRFTSSAVLSNSSSECSVPITFNPNGGAGSYTFTLSIPTGSGGETNNANNSDQETLSFEP